MVVDMGMTWMLASPYVPGWNPSLSKVIAAEVAIFNNFIWNDVWAFRRLAGLANYWRGPLARFCKFNLIS